jgi:hypothetical protein
MAGSVPAMIGKDLDDIGSVSSANMYHYSALTGHRDGGGRRLSNGQDLVGPNLFPEVYWLQGYRFTTSPFRKWNS